MSYYQPGRPGLSTAAKVLIAGAALAAVVLVAALVLLLTNRSSSQQASTVTITESTQTSPSSSTTTTTSSPASSSTTTQQANQGLPSKPLCRDLKAYGYSYSAAVRYWNENGKPDRMDADLNGIPCETVYSAADVRSEYANYSSDFGRDYYDTPSGLMCKDLKARGFSYTEAVAYYYDEGAPDRMDADKNGVPCETVYPASVVASYWNSSEN